MITKKYKILFSSFFVLLFFKSINKRYKNNNITMGMLIIIQNQPKKFGPYIADFDSGGRSNKKNATNRLT
jgi:hypothetical protein